MVATIVSGICVLLISLIAYIIIRAIIKKQQIIGRPPIPAVYFILAKMLVLVNLAFLLLKGLDINVNGIFIPGISIEIMALAILVTGTVILFISTIRLNNDLVFGLSSSEKHKLQTTGIYSISRHPFYLGFIFILFSSCLLNPHYINILAFTGAWILHHFIMIREEEALSSQYGEEYREYAKRVNRYIVLRPGKKTFLTIALFTQLTVVGQIKSVPLNISLFNEATAVPYTRFLTTPIHPGIQVGTEFTYKTKGAGRLFQTVNLSYFYHNYLNQGIGLTTELGYEYRLIFGLALEGLLGIGYLHTFATSEEFVFKDGQYEKKTDTGNSRLYPTISLDIGYYFRHADKTSPKVFLRYQSWAEYPYSPGFIPLMTHINLHLGIKFFIQHKTKNHE
jgi:protein-S-isoprenylcysteine O-methyltransferase Ste14